MSDPGALAILERFQHQLARVAKVDDLARIEARVEKALARYFTRQGADFVGRLGRRRERFGEALSPEEWGRDLDGAIGDSQTGLRVAIKDANEGALLKGGERAVADLGIATSFSLANPRATDWLRDHAAEQVTRIDETTRRYIGRVVTEGVDKGWSYDRTAAAITARYKDMAVGSPLRHIESRAHLIAVTESAMAYEAGNAIVASSLAEAGIQMEKLWVTVGDDRVDEESCGPNEDEGWLPLESDFQSGDTEPPAHPGCRCTTGYRQIGAGEIPGEPGATGSGTAAPTAPAPAGARA